MVADGFSHAEEYAFEIMHLSRKLYLDDDELPFVVLRHDIDAVELGIFLFLVPFAFKNFLDFYLLVEKHRNEPFEHAEIGLVAEYSLGCPVETYVSVANSHNPVSFGNHSQR